MENKINSISNMISDTQEIIRHLETKAAILVTIIGAIIIALFDKSDEIFKNFTSYNEMTQTFLIILVVVLLFNLYICVLFFKPITNPSDNIKDENITNGFQNLFLAEKTYKKGIFFLINSDKYKLETSFKDYFKEFKNGSDKYLLASLTHEYFKLSFIRNLKTTRFNFLITLLYITVAIFIFSYCSIVLQNIHLTQIALICPRYR